MQALTYRVPTSRGSLFARCFGMCAVLLGSSNAIGEELRVPAFTAYILPNPEGARVSERRGITQWTDPKQTVHWYGTWKTPGVATAKVVMRGELDQPYGLRLSMSDQSMEAKFIGKGKDQAVVVEFGAFQIAKPGYQDWKLESLNEPGASAVEVVELILEGDSLGSPHFNMKERRNAASVHLFYPVADGTKVEAFYTEVKAIEDPTTTFYMACGWHRGYFGMQVNSPSERRIIFSVWDSGNEAVDRKKVDDANRVKLVAKGKDVFTGDFGNEGTGGHSHLKYLWKTGETQKFLVTAKPTEETYTIFSGYWFHPEDRQWMLISSWKAPKEGGYLRGLHSFSENFGGNNGHLRRKALYGNQWIRTPSKDWTELTTAGFSFDPTGRSDRFDRFMGVENGAFFLSHGGFLSDATEYGVKFSRPASSSPPQDLPE